MASAALPRADDPKMVESPASMVHASSSYAWAEDGCFKRSHTTIIDGDIWSDSGWFFVGINYDKGKGQRGGGSVVAAVASLAAAAAWQKHVFGGSVE